MIGNLWQFSLIAERRLFPEQFVKKDYLIDMKMDFDKATRTKPLSSKHISMKERKNLLQTSPLNNAMIYLINTNPLD